MSDTTNRDGRIGDDDGVQPTVSADDASTSVTDHDAHQPLVDEGDAPTQQLPTQGDAPAHATEPVDTLAPSTPPPPGGEPPAGGRARGWRRRPANAPVRAGSWQTPRSGWRSWPPAR